MKKYLLLVLALIFSGSLYAKEYNLKVSAPGVVAVGAPFKVEFVFDAKPDNFQLPSWDGFDMVAGPTQSTSVSMSIINGKRENKTEVRYTCVLIALDKGNKIIGSATASLGNKKYKSRPIPIEVVGDEAAPQSGNNQKISKDDILLLVSVDKKNVYKGESLVATVKLATRVDIAGVEGGKFPAFNGFWTQELDVSQTEWIKENINDKIYNTKVIKQYVLFPQRSGDLKVESMSMNIVARITMNNPAQRRSMFDDFFGGGGSYQNIKRKIQTQELIIKVEELPSNAPYSFDGAVGDFTISAKQSSDLLNANSSGDIELTISGKGNFPLLTQPVIELPNSFETYKVKSIDKYKLSDRGSIGSKVYEYPFIARASGKYKIPAVNFTYFNPETKEYKTIVTSEMELGIAVDTTSNIETQQTKIYTAVTKEELKILGTDIKYIETDRARFMTLNSFFIGSSIFYLSIFLLILLFAGSWFYLSKSRTFNKDKVKVRSSKARKIALSRLKVAKGLIDTDGGSQFYQEILKAMWGYVSDKLNIELALLSKNNIRDALSARGVLDEFTFKYLEIISECEMAQYAPSTEGSVIDVYNKSIDIISNIEDNIQQ